MKIRHICYTMSFHDYNVAIGFLRKYRALSEAIRENVRLLAAGKRVVSVVYIPKWRREQKHRIKEMQREMGDLHSEALSVLRSMRGLPDSDSSTAKEIKQ